VSIQVFRAYQGNDAVFTGTLSSSATFTGSETMTCKVTRGDTQAALATLTTTWLDAAAKTITITLAGSASTLIEPDSYLLIASETGSTATFIVGVLQLFPNAGGAGGIRSLCTVPQALIMVPELQSYQAHFDQLPGTLEQATAACETYCRRKLLLSDFDRLYSRPFAGNRELRLDSRPVVSPLTTFDYGSTAITDYELDEQEGVITLGRTWYPAVASYLPVNIRAVYRAGYAYLAADLDLGYPAVPADLKRACAMVANAMMGETDFAGPVFGQAIQRGGVTQSYQLRGNGTAITSVVPDAARIILDGYSEANRGVY
jgi:hypothetical protein